MRPSTRFAADPRARGLAFEDVTFPAASDSVPLHGWWFAGPAGAPVLVVCPAGEGNMADKLPSVPEWLRRGFTVMTFDLRDFGPASAGRADSLEGLVYASRWVSDTEGALRFARRRAVGVPVFAWGQDLGGPLALAAAARRRGTVDGIATEGLFRTSQDHLRWLGLAQDPEIMRAHRIRVWELDEPASAGSRLRVPMFVVIAGRDEVTPAEGTQRLLSRMITGRETWLVPEGRHDHLERTPGYYDRLADWLQRTARQWSRQHPAP